MAECNKKRNDKENDYFEKPEEESSVIKKSAKSNIMMEIAPYASLGLQMVITIVICAYIGWWIDGKNGTSPWFLIVLTFFGAVAGMVTFLRTVMTRNKKNKVMRKNG